MDIKVGIYTEGKPMLEACGDGLHLLSNQAIGVGFHWYSVNRALLPGRIEILPEMLEMSDGGRERCGISMINTLDLEEYVKSVVSSEMNPEAPMEFMKAHAVIARSWALGKILDIHPHDSEGKVDSPDMLIDWADTDSHHGFHVCSDDHCQRYQGVGNLNPRVEEAVEATAGIFLADSEGLPADARFSKCCGGKTELFSTCWQDRDYPYLQSVDDPWCDLSGMSGDERDDFLNRVLKDYDRSLGGLHDWEVMLSPRRVAYNLLDGYGRDVGKLTGIRPLRRGASGRISLMEISGSKATVRVGKELLIRRLLSTSALYSSAFTTDWNGHDELMILKGKGWGHGVGLCQIGAARMAMNGHDFKSILFHYYPGIRIAGCPDEIY